MVHAGTVGQRCITVHIAMVDPQDSVDGLHRSLHGFVAFAAKRSMCTAVGLVHERVRGAVGRAYGLTESPRWNIEVQANYFTIWRALKLPTYNELSNQGTTRTGVPQTGHIAGTGPTDGHSIAGCVQDEIRVTAAGGPRAHVLR